MSIPVAMLVLNNFTHDARVHKEAQALAEAGYAVTVIALWQPGLAEEEAGAGYRVHRLSLWHPGSGERSARDRPNHPGIRYGRGCEPRGSGLDCGGDCPPAGGPGTVRLRQR